MNIITSRLEGISIAHNNVVVGYYFADFNLSHIRKLVRVFSVRSKFLSVLGKRRV